MTPSESVNEGRSENEGGGVAVSTTAREGVSKASNTLYRVCVGTQTGLVVFLGTLVFVGLYWRVGIFINDTYTVANAFVSLADGSLAIQEPIFGGSFETPGMGAHEGQYYGRNYGQLVFALPFLWALEGLTTVADPGLVLPMIWALLVIALGREIGRLLDHPSLGTAVGSVCGLAAFLVNVAFGQPLATRLFPVVALQAGSMVTAAFAVTLLYRLVARIHSRRAGAATAAVTALATPVTLWASIPKRHVTVLALILAVAYAIYRSRSDASSGALVSPLGFRATAYGLVGLLTWVHAGEGFTVFLALVAVDFPTAPSNDRRSLAVVGGVFALSMLPFFTTNALLSGDPLQPPRMLQSFNTISGRSIESSSTGASTAGAWYVETLPPVLAGPVTAVLDRSSIILGQYVRGAVVLATEPGTLVPVFVRGGDIHWVNEVNHNRTTYLTVLESAPVVAGAGAVGAAAVSMVSNGRGLFSSNPGGRLPLRKQLMPESRATVDAFLLLVGGLFGVLYIQRLPLPAQLTVRYLLPLYPLAVYGMIRQPSIRRALDAHWRAGLWTWAAGVLVGAQLFIVVVGAVASLGPGEAIQVHAVVGLVAAAGFGVLAVATVLTEYADRAAAVAGGLAAALGTDLLLLSGLVYFQYGQYALPAAGWVADLLAVA